MNLTPTGHVPWTKSVMASLNVSLRHLAPLEMNPVSHSIRAMFPEFHFDQD